MQAVIGAMTWSRSVKNERAIAKLETAHQKFRNK